MFYITYIYLGYLAPIAETKFQRDNVQVIQFSGTASESSDFQGRLDPGTYIYVDDSTRVPGNVTGKKATSFINL